MQSKGFSKPVLGVFGVLALIGICCWVFQLMNGLAVTVGLAVGLVVLCGSAEGSGVMNGLAVGIGVTLSLMISQFPVKWMS
jgi:hypothetical protein